MLLTYGADYIIINRQIEFASAPKANAIVDIYRETSTDRLVSWADASVLKASDMTISQVQQLHILEELQDWAHTNSLVIENSDGWNARSHRINNVADPKDPQDAVTKAWVTSTKQGYLSEMLAKTQECLAALDTLTASSTSSITKLRDDTLKSVQALKVTLETTGDTKKVELQALYDDLAAALTAYVTVAQANIDKVAASASTSQQEAAASASAAKQSAEEAKVHANTALDTKDEALASIETAKTAALTSIENKQNQVITTIDEQTALDLIALENKRQTSMSDVETKRTEALSDLEASKASTEEALAGYKTAAAAEADRAKKEADRAAAIAGIDTMTNPVIDSILGETFEGGNIGEIINQEEISTNEIDNLLTQQ